MSRSATTRAVATSSTAAPSAKLARATAGDRKNVTNDPSTKQSRVIAMLQSQAGTTIAAMMKATGWQQHSVRGFLAGVVRKRLNLKLGSKEVDGNRVYQITSSEREKSGPRQAKR